MAMLERDVVLIGEDGEGNKCVHLPVTRLGNVEDTAEVKDSVSDDDYIAVTDGGKMKKIKAGTLVPKAEYVDITLSVDGWSGSGPYTKTVNVTGVRASNAVTASPKPESFENAFKFFVYCSAQADGKLTFTAKKVPSVALSYSILIQEVQ